MLWFVGDYASFDPRSQQVTQALARLLHDGRGRLRDPLRRRAQRRQRRPPRRRGGAVRGARRAEHRDARAAASSTASSPPTRTRSTRCATSTRTLGGELAGRPPHELLLELLESGRLEPHAPARAPRHLPRPLLPRPLQRRLRRAAADPRAARLHARRDAAQPRQLVLLRRRRRPDLDPGRARQRAPVREPDPRGGRARRARLLRRRCPKDVTMYEDAIKTSGNAERIELRELTELVEEALVRGRRAGRCGDPGTNPEPPHENQPERYFGRLVCLRQRRERQRSLRAGVGRAVIAESFAPSPPGSPDPAARSRPAASRSCSADRRRGIELRRRVGLQEVVGQRARGHVRPVGRLPRHDLRNACQAAVGRAPKERFEPERLRPGSARMFIHYVAVSSSCPAARA